MILIFDLDQTLVDSNIALEDRTKRNWGKVYNLIPKMTVFPYINEIIFYLNQKMVQTALVSSSPKDYCNRVLSQFNWNFDVVVGYHDTQSHKPNPDPYLKALDSFQIKDHLIYTIGDDVKDIEASKRAGLLSIGCSWGTVSDVDLRRSNPNYFFSEPKQLFDFLKSQIE